MGWEKEFRHDMQTKTPAMTIDRDELGKAIRRIAAAELQRGHATWFHASNEFQAAMEVACVGEWARTMNRLHGWAIRDIRKNSNEYPDCLAETGPKDTKRPEVIGIEVTELVNRDAIMAHQQARGLARTGRLDKISDAERLELLDRMYPEWPPEKFQERLIERVRDKDRRQRDGTLVQQFLLILTDEPDLDTESISRCLTVPFFPRPDTFDAVYLMTPYMPAPNGQGHYPVYDVGFC